MHAPPELEVVEVLAIAAVLAVAGEIFEWGVWPVREEGAEEATGAFAFVGSVEVQVSGRPLARSVSSINLWPTQKSVM